MNHHMENGTRGWWTPEADASLASMVAAGHTMGVMAKEIGRSRCAIAGRMKRLGLTSKSGQGKTIGSRFGNAGRKVDRTPKPKGIKPPRVKRNRANPFGSVNILQKIRTSGAPRSIELPHMPGDPVPLDLRLVELTEATCKWPTSGDGGAARFCGHPKAHGSYCAAHAARSVGIGTQGEISAPREMERAAA